MSSYDIPDLRQRIEHFANLPEPGSPQLELALCRALLEQATNEKSTSQSIALLGRIEKLVVGYQKAEAIANRLLSKGAVSRLMSAFADVILKELESVVPDPEIRFDFITRILDKGPELLEAVMNTEEEVRLAIEDKRAR